jgi:predicted TIM-barrel fold metal-dependent hydrolase
VREHVRFTTQPLEQPRRKSSLQAVLEGVEGIDQMLLFATDYPHWDFDAPKIVTARLPEAWRDRVLSENARSLYRLPTRVPAAV